MILSIFEKLYEDLFKPLPRDDHFERLGFKKLSDTKWEYKGEIIDTSSSDTHPYPLLSGPHHNGFVHIKQLSSIPNVAHGQQKLFKALSKFGVKVVGIYRLMLIPPRTNGCINSALQIVGEYKDRSIIVERALGARTCGQMKYYVAVVKKGASEEETRKRSRLFSSMSWIYSAVIRVLNELDRGKEDATVSAKPPAFWNPRR